MYKTISLFSGAMGLDLGLEESGFEAVVCVENDKSCVKTIEINRPHLPYHRDITQATTKEILKTAKLKVGEADLVVGGPPCQSFSTAGKRLSTKDPRGNLIYNFLKVVSEAKPRFFVMENVKGLISAAINHRPLDKRGIIPLKKDEELGSVFSQLLEDMDKIGYKIIWKVVDAVNYGAPQFRERLIIIGSRDGEDIFIPQQTHFMMHQNPNYRWVTLGQAIINLEDDPGRCSRFSTERARILDKIKSGKNWRSLSPNEIKKALGGAYNSSGGKTGFYRRLTYDEPCPTLVTSPVQKATMLCHPTRTRPLSTLEYARIQEFPEYWNFYGSVADIYRQIGNAVPVKLGKAIGEMLHSVVRSNYKIETKRIRGTSVHKALNEEAICL